MSSDDRFREMFYEEARELLISLEEGLMDLERRQSDRAHLDRTFRAAHSLKGAAAMVGLAAIAEFTHGIEAVLDRIRGGALAVDSDIITTLLEARDHLATMVEAEAAKSPIPPSGELTQRLSHSAARAGFAGLHRRRGERWARSSRREPFAAERSSRIRPESTAPPSDGAQAQAEAGTSQVEENGGSRCAAGARLRTRKKAPLEAS